MEVGAYRVAAVCTFVRWLVSDFLHSGAVMRKRVHLSSSKQSAGSCGPTDLCVHFPTEFESCGLFLCRTHGKFAPDDKVMIKMCCFSVSTLSLIISESMTVPYTRPPTPHTPTHTLTQTPTPTDKHTHTPTDTHTHTHRKSPHSLSARHFYILMSRNDCV